MSYLLGTPFAPWKDGDVKSITFIVTEDCQLRCKYCYITGKNPGKSMSLDVAESAVDYFLDHPDIFPESSVVWEFIGGEPFLEIEVIDQLTDYIKIAMFKRNHKWFNSYMLGISTNGLLYRSPKVQNFIRKNQQHLSIGLTIDGTKSKHDLQRIFPNGSGSYDIVSDNAKLWLEQFPNATTKVTVSHDDLPFLAESVLHLWQFGLQAININVVFEDCWTEGDAELFELELRKLANHIIEDRLYLNHNFSFFSRSIGQPLDPEVDNQNWCGAGNMIAVDSEGNFYPCIRFAAYSLSNQAPLLVGNVRSGIDEDRLRPFLALDRISQSEWKCIDCEVASGCAWCQGANYDTSIAGTIYERATFICDMHKARVRANQYYWSNFDALAVD